MAKPKPILSEIAGYATDEALRPYEESRWLPEHILRSESVAAGGAPGLFALYDEMEQKDGHLFAVLQTRKNGLLSRPRTVVAASESPRDQRVARFVEAALRGIGGLEQALRNMLDALGKGLSVQEVLWRVGPEGIVPKRLVSRDPGRFVPLPDGGLALRPDPFRPAARAESARSLAPRKFLVFRFGGLYDAPYGRGLCARAYWYYFFKKNNLKFWVIFNEKFGSPTVVGRYRPGAPEEDRERLMEVIENLQNDTGVTVPESVALELLEARRSGSADTYRDLADWCNDEISKIVLGATLTSGEGRRSGSLAMAKVHEAVRDEYVEADARALEEAVNGQLVRWIVDFNFGTGLPAPRWTIDTSREEDLEREARIDRELLAAGVALPRAYFYEKYQRPAPLADEAALRYDDQNLFQYHLRYGILTVNEARERLGMAPVPWGEERVRPLQSETAEGTGLPAAPGAPEPQSLENPAEKAEARREREEG